jgi:hypothetical protein
MDDPSVRGMQKFEDKRPKVRGQTDKSSGTPDKSSGTLPLSDFAFFVLKTPKNAKSNSGSVPELLSGVPEPPDIYSGVPSLLILSEKC